MTGQDISGQYWPHHHDYGVSYCHFTSSVVALDAGIQSKFEGGSKSTIAWGINLRQQLTPIDLSDQFLGPQLTRRRHAKLPQVPLFKATNMVVHSPFHCKHQCLGHSYPGQLGDEELYQGINQGNTFPWLVFLVFSFLGGSMCCYLGCWCLRESFWKFW